MSDEEKQTESKEGAPLVDLTSLEFGPAWARGGGGEKQTQKKHQEWAAKEERGPKRRGGGRDFKGGGGGGRDFKGGGGGQRDHRGGGPRGGGQRDNRGGGGRRDSRRDSRDGRREEVPAPEGVVAQVMPVEDGLDSLAKEILAAGRTYAVFDLAKLVLGARERFNVGFKCEGDKKLYRCRKDGSLWLSKEDAIQGFWNGQWRKEYYEQVFSEAEPPKGNFQAVAKCGFSGEYLGPPNYHGYQSAIVQLHRERFSNMSLDAYKKRIQMEHGEEAVSSWMEKMSRKVQYRPTGGKAPEQEVKEQEVSEPEVKEEETVPQEEASRKELPQEGVASAAVEPEVAAEVSAGEAPSAEVPAEPSGEAELSGEVVAEESPGVIGAGEAEEEAEVVEGLIGEGSPAEAPVAEEDLLDDLRAVERHFVETHFDEVFHATPKAWVPGGIAGNLLSPPLLTLLRNTVAEERRYPGKLTPMLCRQLSGRHVAVFKWRKKLKAGPARPHTVPEDIVLADRPRMLLEWLKENSGKKLENLWKDILPEGADDALKHAWYHDLHWVLNQGYGLLISDSTLHIARKGEPAEQSKKKGGPKKQAGEQKDGEKASEGEANAAEKPAAELAEKEISKGEVPVPEALAVEEMPVSVPAASEQETAAPAEETPVLDSPSVPEASVPEAPIEEEKPASEQPQG